MKNFLLFLVAPALWAQQVIPLWQGPAPGSENWMQQELQYKNARGEAMVRNVVNPTLTAYLPVKDQATGTAVIIAPGGGFRFLSWDSEGVFVAKWLAGRGVAAFVLKYRVAESPAPEAEYQTFLASFMASLGKTPTNQISPEIQNLAAEDCRQAVKLLRQRSGEFGIRANRIVLMGLFRRSHRHGEGRHEPGRHYPTGLYRAHLRRGHQWQHHPEARPTSLHTGGQ